MYGRWRPGAEHSLPQGSGHSRGVHTRQGTPAGQATYTAFPYEYKGVGIFSSISIYCDFIFVFLKTNGLKMK